MARVTRVALFEREVRERLSHSAVDLLFARAHMISEGQRDKTGKSWFGSTMITIDLAALGAFLREPGDAGTARRLASLVQSDAYAQRRVLALAASETARVAGARPRGLETQIRISAQGARVLVDIDVEAAL